MSNSDKACVSQSSLLDARRVSQILKSVRTSEVNRQSTVQQQKKEKKKKHHIKSRT